MHTEIGFQIQAKHNLKIAHLKTETNAGSKCKVTADAANGCDEIGNRFPHDCKMQFHSRIQKLHAN